MRARNKSPSRRRRRGIYSWPESWEIPFLTEKIFGNTILMIHILKVIHHYLIKIKTFHFPSLDWLFSSLMLVISWFSQLHCSKALKNWPKANLSRALEQCSWENQLRTQPGSKTVFWRKKLSIEAERHLVGLVYFNLYALTSWAYIPI